MYDVTVELSVFLGRTEPIPVYFSHELYARSEVSLHFLRKPDSQLFTDFCPPVEKLKIAVDKRQL